MLSQIFILAEARFKNGHGQLKPNLQTLISSFSISSQATDPQHRIFGILGLLPEGIQRSAIIVDYNKTTEQVYMEATRAILEHQQSVAFFRYLNVPLDLRGRSIPSWVPSYDHNPIIVLVAIHPKT
jgi:hypothetical protein